MHCVAEIALFLLLSTLSLFFFLHGLFDFPHLAGGMGVVGGLTMTPKYLKGQIDEIKALLKVRVASFYKTTIIVLVYLVCMLHSNALNLGPCSPRAPHPLF